MLRLLAGLKSETVLVVPRAAAHIARTMTDPNPSRRMSPPIALCPERVDFSNISHIPQLRSVQPAQVLLLVVADKRVMGNQTVQSIRMTSPGVRTCGVITTARERSSFCG